MWSVMTFKIAARASAETAGSARFFFMYSSSSSRICSYRDGWSFWSYMQVKAPPSPVVDRGEITETRRNISCEDTRVGQTRTEVTESRESYNSGCRIVSAFPATYAVFRTLSVAPRGHGSPYAEERSPATFMALFVPLTTARILSDRGPR
jgi:hypothetical protein